MKPTMNTALSLLCLFGITACSGGSSTGAIPKQIQPGAVTTVTTESANPGTSTQSEQDKIDQLQAELNEQKSANKRAQEELVKTKQSVLNLQSQLAELTKAKILGEEKSEAEENPEKKEKLEKLESDSNNREERLVEKATNYQLGTTTADKTQLINDLKNGSDLQRQADNEKKNINTFIGVAAKLPAGTVLSTTQKSYGGYAIVREAFSETISADKPLNGFVVIAKNATTNKDAVVDATYKGSAALSTGNFMTILEKNNAGIPHYELSLNVKNKAVSGEITNTTPGVLAKREAAKQPREIITLQNANIEVNDDIVGFSGNAVFNYGEGFLPTADGNGRGTYKGIFAGDKAEEVVGSFTTDDLGKKNSVQGAFVGVRQ